MGRGYFTGKPWLSTPDWGTFQIGQCRLHINQKRTKEFYITQPNISVNCSCGYCAYFERDVINQPNKLFALLSRMDVDISKQPHINPDGVCCIGETKPGKLGYMGYYFVYGEIGKTSKKTAILSDDNRVDEVRFNNAEFGNDTQVIIKQVEKDKLSFQFYMEVDNTLENGKHA